MIIAFLVAVLSLDGWSLPTENLNGEPRRFPADIVESRAVIVLTFSKAASDQATEWTQKLRATGGKLSAGIYQIAVLEDVPALFRSFIISAMRRSIPRTLHDNFWIAIASSKEWQDRTGSTSLGEPQVFLLEDRTQIVWRFHGAFSESALEALVAALSQKH
jgi:hypothetical protein